MNPEVTKTIEGINAQVADINKATSGRTGLTPLTPITPNSLSENVPVMEVPSATPLSTDGSLAGMETMATQAQDAQQKFIDQQTQQRESLGAARVDSIESLLGALEAGQTQTEIQMNAEKEFGLETKRNELNRLNNELLQEQTALRRSIEQINKNGGGLKAGAQSEIENLQRASYAKQADIAIVQMAAQGAFESAQRLANQKQQVIFEKQQQDLEIRQFIYNENKELFNKAEQREFEAKQSQLTRQLDQERADFETLQSTKLSALQMAQMNGAPADVLQSIQSAQTPEEVLKVGGQWGSVDMLEQQYKRQQIASSRTNQLLALAAAGDTSAIEELGFDPSEVPEKLDATTKRNAEATFDATGDLLRMAMEYKSIIDTEGFTNTIFGSGETLGKIESLRGQMTAAYKDAKKLGTLDAGLLELMDSILGEEPTSTFFVTENLTGKKSKKISTAMQELIDQTAIENARSGHLIGKEPWSNPLDLDFDEVRQNSTQNTSTNPLGI